MAPGTYDVTFAPGTDVGACAWLATARETGFNASVQAPQAASDRAVRVLTTKAAGALQNSIFLVALVCSGRRKDRR